MITEEVWVGGLRVDVDIDSENLPEGAILRRWYKDRCYVVNVVCPVTTTAAAARRGWWRYQWNDTRYKTLSAIAYLITGDRTMSGHRFFGLRSRRGQCRKRLKNC